MAIRVKVGFLGILGEYAGARRVELDVPDRATVGDLVREVGQRYVFPHGLWDPGRQAFGPSVGLFLDGTDLTDEEAPLRDGSELLLVPVISGG